MLFLLATAGLVLSVLACAPKTRVQYTNEVVKSYRSMKEGDWTYYDLTPEIGVMLYVTKVTGDSVVIRRHMYFRSAPVQGDFPLEFRFDDIKKHLLSGKDLWGKMDASPPVISHDAVEIMGKKIDCAVYTVKTPGGEISTYVSDKIPMDGVVMVRRNRVIIRVIKNFGHTEKAKPAPDR